MEVLINKLDHEGRGITRINNKVTFVKKALPNELVEVKITKEKKNYNEAEITKIIKKSIDREEPICPYYNECGGCDIMHMNYESAVSWKKEKVINIFKKYLGIDINPEIVNSNKQFNYRNKITLHGDGNRLGYMKSLSNEIIEIDSCPLASESINNYIKELKTKENITIRTNELGEIISTIKKETLIETINEYKFQVDINSFFQVNSYICGRIFKELENNIEECENILDLYSGVGTLSIVASTKAKKVYSIEINENSHKNAIINKKLNKRNNIEFMLGKVEEKIKEIKEKIDIIITDPPRSGMDSSTINIIKEMNPKKIIYISCDPMTLVRDLNLINEYKIEKVKIFDMFPNTKHVETMCVLIKK